MILMMICIFFSTTIGILFIIKNFYMLNLLDIPNGRSAHSQPKPRGAGIAIYLSFILSILLFEKKFFIDFYPFFIALSIVFFIGVYDDIIGSKPKVKFLFIAIAVIILYFTGDFKIDNFGEWFGYEVQLPIYVALPFTIFAVVGYTNALNLIDGLDGLAGGVSFVILLSFLYLGNIYHDSFIITVSLLYLVSILSFLLFNWYPSKIFMGDSGSLMLGFIISVLAIRLIKHVNITSVLFLASLPILDTIMVMVRRIQRGKSPFNPDKTHIHHKLLRWKTKVDFSVWIVLLLQLVFSLLGILLSNGNNFLNILIYFVIVYISFIIFDERRVPRGESKIKFHTKVTNFLLSNKYSYLFLTTIIGLMFLLK